MVGLSLSSCGIGGWWIDRAPNAGHTQTSTEISDWIKLNTDEVRRTKDWVSCGGTKAGMVKFSEPKPNISRYEQSVEADKEYDAVQACMMKKEYRFTGSCKGPLGGNLACRSKGFFH